MNDSSSAGDDEPESLHSHLVDATAHLFAIKGPAEREESEKFHLALALVHMIKALKLVMGYSPIEIQHMSEEVIAFWERERPWD